MGEGALIGELAALTAAFWWAAATLMFGKLGQTLSPLVLNLVKGLFAIAFLLLTLAVQAAIQGPLSAGSQGLPIRSAIYLVLSGGLGIGFGDTAYFAAINTLGARRALLLETLAPPMAAILAWIFLTEQLSFRAIAGIVITLVGIAWVISERVPGTSKATVGAGVRMALLATFCQASGAVLSRAALADVAVQPLLSSLIRLIAGLAFMVILWGLRLPYLLTERSSPDRSSPDRSSPNRLLEQDSWASTVSALKSPRILATVAITSFFATYLGIWLQQISLKYTAAGIAQALLATSPLFVLPMAAILGEKISWRSLAGVAIALGGIWLLLYAA
ncbi:MAG: DMT family transporter [Phormidesmis sp. RL_2_1]|nr:DMT family transporter [Phormidesmis sp. RL_2_1]